MAPIHYPGHRFLGPGTKDLGADPVDVDDHIAKHHDIAYRDALSEQDIFTADSQAIGEFWEDFSKTWNPHSLIGFGGLGIKHLAEKAWGKPLYGMPNKRPHPYLTPPQTPNVKHSRKDMPGPSKDDIERDTPIDMEVNTGDAVPSEEAPSTNSGGGANPQVGGATQISISKIARVFGPGLYRFSKSWIICTWGFQQRNMITTTAGSVGRWLTNELARIPVHKTQLYMSPAEWNELPNTSRAISCHAKVIPKGFRAPFQTGTTISSAANSQMLVFGRTAQGMNLHFNGAYGTLSAIESNPTLPATYTTSTVPDWGLFFYGQGTTQATQEVLCASTGLQKRLPEHLMLAMSNTGTFNVPDTNSFIKTFDMRTQVGMPLENYHYEFGEGILKTGYRNQVISFDTVTIGDLNYEENASYNATNATNTAAEHQYQTGYVHSAHLPKDVVARPSDTDPDLNNSFLGVNNPLRTADGVTRWTGAYDDMLEKSSFIFPRDDLPRNAKFQPDLMCGVLAPLTTNPFAANPEFAQVMAYWQIDTELIVETWAGTNHTLFATPGPKGMLYHSNKGRVSFEDCNHFGSCRNMYGNTPTMFPPGTIPPPNYAIRKKKFPTVDPTFKIPEMPVV